MKVVKKSTSRKKTTNGMNSLPPGTRGVVIEETPRQRTQSAQMAANRRPSEALWPTGAPDPGEFSEPSPVVAMIGIYPTSARKCFT
jgi:hypothetical protein